MLPLLPIVLAMIVISLRANQGQIERANESTENYALIASGYQTGTLSDLKQILNVIVEGNDYKSGTPACSRSLNKVLARLEVYSSIAVADKSGHIVCGTGGSDGLDLSDRDYFKLGRNSLQFTMSQVLVNRSTNRPIIAGAMPWTDDNGEFAGMAVATIDAEVFASSFRNMPLPPGSSFYLLDRNNGTVAASNELSTALREKLKTLPVIDSKPTTFTIQEDGGTRTYTGVALQNGALTLLIGIPRKFFLNVNPGNFAVSLFGPIALLLVVLVTTWYLSERLITAPVRSLIRTARAYSRGDLSARPLSRSAGGELKELSETFADMANRISSREAELQDAIHRKELMMREIHHRVKNNLQIVISLINLQSKSVAVPAAQEAFTEIQTRMRALALVHRYLYESDDLQSVNIGAFVTELCSSLQLAYGISPSRVLLDVQADPVWDVSDRAIPLALFMTETISNALRHAFPEGRPGNIHVRLKALDNDMARFSVDDDGVGMESEPPPVEDGIFRAARPLAGLGMSLTKAFAHQVNGELTLTGPPGTQVTLVFKTRRVSDLGA